MNEELKNLFEGSELSDEFKTKVTEIFETAVAELVEKEKEQIEESYSKKVEEYSEYVIAEMEDKTEQYIQTELIPVVEKYLDYAVQEQFSENESLVESHIKVELADKFLSGLVGLTEGYNIVVPEGQDNLVEELQAKLDEMQKRFDSVLDEKAQLQEEINVAKMTQIVSAKVSDLTESQKEKFSKIAKDVKFISVEQYQEAIDELYESYFPVDAASDKQSLNEDVDTTVVKTVAQDPWLNSVLSRI